MLDSHFDDFRLLHPAASLLHVVGRNQLAQVGKTVVHPVPATLLDDSMRRWVLLLHAAVCLGLLTGALIRLCLPAGARFSCWLATRGPCDMNAVNCGP